MGESLRGNVLPHKEGNAHASRMRPFLVALIFLSLAPSSLISQSQTQWLGVTQFWRSSSNWNAGVPHATIDVLISNTGFAPYVPVPESGDTARTRDLKLQNDGELFFDPSAILIVQGPEVSQQGSLINLGSGTILFTSNVTFLNGGTFDAGSGTLHFQGVTWQNNSGSTFTPGTSTVILEGNNSQSIVVDTTINMQFYDLQILTQGTVTITGSVTVQNNCYVAAGCTLNVPAGSSFIVNGTFVNDGIITGSGSVSAPLPVQLSSFSAAASGLTAILRWTTATETNNYGFEIERRAVVSSKLTVVSSRLTVASSDKLGTGNSELGTAWISVGFVRGSGTSSSPRDYSFIDRDVSPGRYAYRLRQIDLDGSDSYYHAAEVEIGLAPLSLTLGQNFPNPFNPTTTIEFTLPEPGRAVLKVFNIAGQEVATIFDSEAEAGRIYRATFEASALSSGLYFARLQFGPQSLLRRMVLVR